jgi:hypothetical protein
LVDCEHFLQILQGIEVVRLKERPAPKSFFVDAGKPKAATWRRLARRLEIKTGLQDLPDGGELRLCFRPSRYLPRGQDLVLQLFGDRPSPLTVTKLSARIEPS